LGLSTRVTQGREQRHKVRHHRVIGGLVNFHISQAFRQAVPNGRYYASGAIWWEGRGQLDHDVPKQVQTHRDSVKIA